MRVKAAGQSREDPMGASQVALSLSGELHAVYDRILEKPLPLSFGRLIGELVFRDLYPFSTDFEPKFRSNKVK